MPTKKTKLQHPDFWKRMHAATRQAKPLYCWEMGTPKNIRPRHLKKLVKIETHTVEIGTTCHDCGQTLTIKQILRALEKL